MPSCEPPAEIWDLDVPGFGEGFRKVRVLRPSGVEGCARTLVLLHGLGETHQPAQALRAWPTLYGASEADVRLRCPPFVPPGAKPRFWTNESLARFNEGLAQRPYQGAILVCPRTPNPSLASNRDKLFDAYSEWLCEAVLPAVEAQSPGATKYVGLDGCSMGGYVAMEVLVRRAATFATAGCIQGALGQHRVVRYAALLAALHEANPKFQFRIATSLGDPYLDVGKVLSKRLTDLGVAHELDVVPGPHNQPWLCEIGTPRLLRWHDETLAGRAPTKAGTP